MFPALSRRALLALASGPALAGETPSLRLLSEDFPPINHLADGRPAGMASELVLALQQRLGLQIPIEFMPWPRAYSEVQGNAPVCLFTMARTEQREKLFKWVGPVVEFQNALFAVRGSDYRYRSVDEAMQASRIVVIKDWASAQELQRRGFKNLLEVSQPSTALRMLIAGRVPLMASELLTLPELLRREGQPADAIVTASTYPGALGYLAFSQATPDAEVQRWQKALDAMKRDGSFAKLFRRWLPHMLPP